MRRAAYALAILLLALGAWQIGQGAWIHAKAALAQVLIKRAWAEGRTDQPARPWPWADTFPVARLTVPALGVDQIVLAGASGRTLAFGPGHMDGTAMPGEPGLTVISGHRDTHFEFLRALKADQLIELTNAAGTAHRFRVTGGHVVDADKVGLDATGDMPRLALVTCYPFDAAGAGSPLRYVVFAEAEAETLDAAHSPIAIPGPPPI
jgi:sortase A